jgi:hypothetical protein
MRQWERHGRLVGGGLPSGGGSDGSEDGAVLDGMGGPVHIAAGDTTLLRLPVLGLLAGGIAGMINPVGVFLVSEAAVNSPPLAFAVVVVVAVLHLALKRCRLLRLRARTSEVF